MTKQDLRKLYKKIRDGIPDEVRAAKSAAVCARVLSSAAYAEAERVFVFLSFGGEVDTTGIVVDALARGKRVAVPVTKAGGVMDFVALRSMDDLVLSRFDVPEPSSGEAVLPNEQTLMLVPGLVFGRDGFRVGYGKGFYDRYLARVMVDGLWFPRIGIGFDEQLAESVPHDGFDMALDGVWTDERMLKRADCGSSPQ